MAFQWSDVWAGIRAAPVLENLLGPYGRTFAAGVVTEAVQACVKGSDLSLSSLYTTAAVAGVWGAGELARSAYGYISTGYGLSKQRNLLKADLRNEIESVQQNIRVTDPTDVARRGALVNVLNRLQVLLAAADGKNLAQLETDRQELNRLRQSGTLVPEIWQLLADQGLKVGVLSGRLAALTPAAADVADQGNIDGLNFLKNQLTLRGDAVANLSKLELTKAFQILRQKLTLFKAAQEAVIQQIAVKSAQIRDKEALLPLESQEKTWLGLGESPHQKLQREINQIKTEVSTLRENFINSAGLFHDIAADVAFLQAQPDGAVFQPLAQALNDVAAQQAIIGGVGVGDAAIANAREEIQKNPSLQPAEIQKYIDEVNKRLAKLPQLNPGVVQTHITSLDVVKGALNVVVDAAGLGAQQATFMPIKAAIVAAMPAAPVPAAPPGDVPVVGPQAVPKERSWTTILGTGVVGAASIVGGAFTAPWTTLAATTVVASAAADHILFGGKGRKYIQDQLQEWRGTRPDIVHLVDIPADHPLPPAPTPTGFEALGKVAAAEYELGSKPVENTANPVPFKFDQPVAFARGDVHAGAAASLQALVKVKPLMDGLVNAMAKFNLVESSLFGANGAAHVGHSLARNLQEVQRQLAAPDVVDRARLEAKRDILARKVAALKWIAHAFQPDVQIDGHGAEPLTKADLLIQLRALTEGGLDDVPGLDPKAKQAIFKARVQLELNDVLSRANSKQTIGDADLTNLFNAVSGWKTPLEQSYLPQKFPNWPQGALKPSDVQTFTRMLISAVDDATKAVKKYYQAAPYKYRDEALGDDQTVFVVFDAVQPTGTTVKHGKKDYHLVSVVKQTGLADNPQDSTALVREKTSNSWWSCNKRVEAGDQNTQVAYAEAPAKEYRVLFFVRKDKSK